MNDFEIGVADFSDQGRLGKLLCDLCGPVWQREEEKAKAAGQNAPAYADELMAADDFFFSNAELMNCCWFARSGQEIIGAACVNPFTFTLHYLVVRPEWRRRGAGRKLLKAAEGTVRRYGGKSLKIEFSIAEEFAGAEEFFLKCGYIELRRQCTYAGNLDRN